MFVVNMKKKTTRFYLITTMVLGASPCGPILNSQIAT
jgi:hypothetical protein